MRLIRQRIEKRDGSGTATLLPEEPEDMVFIYLTVAVTYILLACLISYCSPLIIFCARYMTLVA